MNLDVFSASLQNIGKVRHGVDEFHKLAVEIQKEEAQVKALEAHIEKCNGVKSELDLERRNHAEELRQINQDINTLEDITKSSRAELESRKRRINMVIGEVEKMRGALNNNLESMSIVYKLEPSEEEVSFKESRSQTAPITPQINIVPEIPAFLQSLLDSAAAQQSSEMSTSSNLINRHRMPPSFVEASKMKICDNCGANIHRNAPTCPVCKMKTRSKNPKKKPPKRSTFPGMGF